jgi:hypothetical protein
MSNSNSPYERKAPDIPFQWHKLPEELKREILSYVILQKQSLRSIHTRLTQELLRFAVSSQELEWNIHARDINSTGEWLSVINKGPWPLVSPPMFETLGTYAVLLRVKAFASKARGMCSRSKHMSTLDTIPTASWRI